MSGGGFGVPMMATLKGFPPIVAWKIEQLVKKRAAAEKAERERAEKEAALLAALAAAEAAHRLAEEKRAAVDGMPEGAAKDSALADLERLKALADEADALADEADADLEEAEQARDDAEQEFSEANEKQDEREAKRAEEEAREKAREPLDPMVLKWMKFGVTPTLTTEQIRQCEETYAALAAAIDKDGAVKKEALSEATCMEGDVETFAKMDTDRDSQVSLDRWVEFLIRQHRAKCTRAQVPVSYVVPDTWSPGQRVPVDLPENAGTVEIVPAHPDGSPVGPGDALSQSCGVGPHTDELRKRADLWLLDLLCALQRWTHHAAVDRLHGEVEDLRARISAMSDGPEKEVLNARSI